MRFALWAVFVCAALASASGRAQTPAPQIVYASADGVGGYYRDGVNETFVRAPPLDEVLAGIKGTLARPVIVQLLTRKPVDDLLREGPDAATVFRNDRGDCSYLIAGVLGTPTLGLTIKGVRHAGRWLTRFEGDSVANVVGGDPTCNVVALAQRPLGHFDIGARSRDPVILRLQRSEPGAVGPDPGFRPRLLQATGRFREIRCLHVIESRHVAFVDLAFKDCWYSAVHIVDSSEIAVRDTFIRGSTYAIHATRRAAARQTLRGYTVEKTIWIQDDSGYARAPGQPGCTVGDDPARCPGEMWSTIPWGASHDTWKEHYNGALFGSFDVWGDVTFRGNLVSNAYNGIRMVLSSRCSRDPACRIHVNNDVRVIDNDFVLIRDNPVEPERRAVRWTVALNRIQNSHAWFSFDKVADGPIYIWGNTAWHDDVPGRLCRPDPVHAELKRVDFEHGGYRPINELGEPLEAYGCAASRFGTVLKEGSAGDALEKHIYVFHNSWYLRTPIVRGGQSGRIHYWNNAMHAIACGELPHEPHSLCRIELGETDPACLTRFTNHLTDDGRALFFKCIDAAQMLDRGVYDFRYNISSLGAPARFLAVPGRADAVIKADPGFRALPGSPGGADFRLRPDSAAVGRGCIVEVEDAASGKLRCRPAKPDESPSDIGAYLRDGTLYRGLK